MEYARLRSLVERLVMSGSKAEHVSASECHEIHDDVVELLATLATMHSDAHLAREAMAAVQEDLKKAEERIAEVTKERDEARESCEAMKDAERPGAVMKARVAAFRMMNEKNAALREADRLRHGIPVEGDFVCPAELDRDLWKERAEGFRDSALGMLAERDAALADASRLRTENEAMRAVVAAVKKMPDRLLPLPGDWACRECRPESDILVDGFQCQTHALKAALAALASKNGDGE